VCLVLYFFAFLGLSLLFVLHDRNINLLKNNTVPVLFKVFGGMNDHIDFSHRGFID
jgi:hypothetical protein